ncbi:sulfatase [Micromonospora sp. NPDC049679]|uniref:sulfatase n=1 Tax=Micromonospora sp. NPDC049679 TaxID=3155920 RepID=UPI003403E523
MFLFTRFRRPPTQGRSGAEESLTTDRPPERTARDDLPGDTGGSDRLGTHSVLAWVTSALAGLLVLFALVAPNQLNRLTPGAFVRIPLEGLVAVTLLLVLPGRARRVGAPLLGSALGLLTILKIIDMGFFTAFDRPFHLGVDWVLFDDGVGFLADSFGRFAATGAVVAAVLLVTVLLILMTLSVLRLARLVARHDTRARRTVAVLAVVWLACAALGVRIVPGVPVADSSATALVYDHAQQVGAGLRDRKTFAAEIADDAFRDVPGEQLLTALRGKHVVIAFIESYGRDAVEDPEFATQVGAVLDAGDSRLRAAGFTSRSGFLTSPAMGGGSWLAHDTLLSGLWIDNEQRHRGLLASDRLTLGAAFRRANWQTVGVMPAVSQDWPEGAVFGHERFYDVRDLGYEGPTFAYAPIPDQYTLSAYHRLAQATPDRAPVMAEIALVSSHSPWTTIPRLLDWKEIGDGSVFHNAAAATERPQAGAKGDPVTRARTGYRRAIEYSLNSVISYVETYGDDDLVLVVLGDHQPTPLITGEGATRDVPISIVARDRAVLERISGWRWQDGLKPGPQAPVWRMDAFRDRFLTAFGPGRAAG